MYTSYAFTFEHEKELQQAPITQILFATFVLYIKSKSQEHLIICLNTVCFNAELLSDVINSAP